MQKTQLIYILLGARRRVGKDTFGRFLVEELSSRGLPVYQRSFAGALRDEVADAMATCSELRSTSIWTEEASLKENVTRPLLIAWGQARRYFDPNCWVDKVIEFANFVRVRDGVRHQPRCFIIVPDWRFSNELIRVKEEAVKHGDRVVSLNITRPDAPEGTADEIANAPICAALATGEVGNNGSLEDLRKSAIQIVDAILK